MAMIGAVVFVVSAVGGSVVFAAVVLALAGKVMFAAGVVAVAGVVINAAGGMAVAGDVMFADVALGGAVCPSCGGYGCHCGCLAAKPECWFG